MKWIVAEQTVQPRRIACLRRHVTFGVDALSEIIGELYGELYPAFPPGAQTGQNVIAYVPVGDRTADMFVGVEWNEPLPAGLEAFDLPSARVAHTRHVGPYEQLPQAHQAVHAWLREQGQNEVGLNWEVYGPWNDDTAQLVTDVHYVRLPLPA